MVTHCISTYNNLPYLRLVLASIEKNAHFKKVFVYAENCDDGTVEYLRGIKYGENGDKKTTLDLNYDIAYNPVSVGIGGGMNQCAMHVTTEYINFLHSDMWVTKDFDIPLLNLIKDAPKTIASSWRVEPDIFGGTDRMGTTVSPKEAFGFLHDNFDYTSFEDWAIEFISNNLIRFRKAEGVSFMISKSDWDLVGGNDYIFAPAAFDDHDLFLRMTALGFDFIETSESLVFHFGARGSIFRGDDLTKRHPRQTKAEQENILKWVDKWGSHPVFDQNGFIVMTPELEKRFKEIYDTKI